MAAQEINAVRNIASSRYPFGVLMPSIPDTLLDSPEFNMAEYTRCLPQVERGGNLSKRLAPFSPLPLASTTPAHGSEAQIEIRTYK